jgi:hypothetical protein
VPGVSPSVSSPNAQAWFNPAAFDLQTTPYGTVGRDTIWGPHLQQWDLGVAKRFAYSEIGVTERLALDDLADLYLCGSPSSIHHIHDMARRGHYGFVVRTDHHVQCKRLAQPGIMLALRRQRCPGSPERHLKPQNRSAR